MSTPVLKLQDEVTFSINGKKYKADKNIPGETSLNAFIRDHANLKGTKNMCHEGGCGACVVSVTSKDLISQKDVTYAVNSCLVPIFSCHGWSITTIEGIGDKSKGYHQIQDRLSKKHGTQCGYCSPGMVMNMYALTKDKNVTMKEVENSFGGNICRCTGYRPILDAFKSLASDAPKDGNQDIEDICSGVKICPKSGLNCNDSCRKIDPAIADSPVRVILAGDADADADAEWLRVMSVKELFDSLSTAGDRPYMLVAGNTAQGVYRRTVNPKIYIDITGVQELHTSSTSPQLVLGANMSLTKVMELLYSVSKNPGYAYTKELADHIDLIANVPVRNIGTLAGNLSIKNQYREFPSDMFLMLEAVGATVTVMDKDLKKTTMSLPALLDMDMGFKLIHSVNLPSLADDAYVVKTYKIMPRAQNAHAYVNAGFMFKVDKANKGLVLEVPNIVFGGIEPEFIHASKTEQYLTGKNLFERDILSAALTILDGELAPDAILPDASVEYRKGLAKALFYKFVLSQVGNKLPPNLISGGQNLVRPLSTGRQEYETDKSIWPLNEPVAKLESLVQCAGEAQYVGDVHALPGELHAAFVLTQVGQGTIKKVDASAALKQPGVVAFFEAKDIPGDNSFTTVMFGFLDSEEVFCSGQIKYAGQPVGMIVAKSHREANDAVKHVVVEVDAKKGVYTLEEALKAGDMSRIVTKKVKEATKIDTRQDATHVIKGKFSIGGQYHYTMETQTCVVVPIEDGFDVYPASQWMDLVQITMAAALKIPENKINVKVRRLGGAYGAKISRTCMLSVGCAVAAQRLNVPVRMVMSLETNMESCGKRFDLAIDYVAGVNDEGAIKYLDSTIYQNSGWTHNESVVGQTMEHMVTCYEDDTWTVTGKEVRTDVASNTYCRAPGSTEGVAFIENIMEHIARALKKDPVQVRMNNLSDTENKTIEGLINEHVAATDYVARKKAVEDYNKENRWKKRGIALVPMRYPFAFWGNFHAIVSIYGIDGTVSVAHGGIEMGQGMNTKVAQVVAHILGIPLEKVSVKPSNNLTAPNGMVTGGSLGSEACAYAAMMCCKELLKRLEPIKEKLKDPTWEQITLKASQEAVDMCATYMFTAKDDVKAYNIWGVTVAEVELDLLTGQHLILRVDILEDAGKSLSPEVDIGQVEGAFVMGLGYWLSEALVFHPENGKLLTNRTWNYKPPGAKDIPIDFRIQLRRNAPNPTGVLRSKATGEPPLCMSIVVFFAVRNALDSARADSGKVEDWFEMNAPATAENIFLTSLTNNQQFIL